MPPARHPRPVHAGRGALQPNIDRHHALPRGPFGERDRHLAAVHLTSALASMDDSRKTNAMASS
jgi:hypothetical protein